MSRRGMNKWAFRAMAVLAGVATLVVTSGCSAARSRANRTRVLEAEILDARQSNDALRGQVAAANNGQDRATSQLQQANYERDQLSQKVTDLDGRFGSMVERSSSAEARAEVAERRVHDLTPQVETLLAARRAHRKRIAELEAGARGPVGPVAGGAAPFDAGQDAQLTAMKRDLESRMAAAGIHMPVEIRAASNGRRGVAVVLPDTFKSGKASLAYNPTAVQAVVGLGTIVKSNYQGARISVEGHTDSDPIRRSPWASNEELSLARATEVRKLLTDTGIDASGIGVAGLGARQPIARGASARAKSRNRRVEIFIDAPR